MPLDNKNLAGNGGLVTVTTRAALRALPSPISPPPGPLDSVIGMLLARAAPFDEETQLALRQQQGWWAAAPVAIAQVRSHGRWQATPALRRLTRTSPPASLIAALALLEQLAPCPVDNAAASLVAMGLVEERMHPGGVLNLARWYGLPTGLRCEAAASLGEYLLAPMSADLRPLLRSATARLSRAGYLHLGRLAVDGEQPRRQLEYALTLNRRLDRDGDLLIRVDDRSSALTRQVQRMLIFAPRPLTLAELHAGLQRYWRFRRRRLPDLAIVEAWLACQPGLNSSPEGVHLAQTLSATERKTALGSRTAQLAGAVAGGATATWAELVTALTSAGMRPDAACIAAHTSPILEHVGLNAYRLRGSAPAVPSRDGS